MKIETLRWFNNRLEMIDQRILPAAFEYLSYYTASSVAEGIRHMVVRGGAGDVIRHRHRQQAVDVGSGQPGVVQGAANRLELERERGPFGKFALFFVT